MTTTALAWLPDRCTAALVEVPSPREPPRAGEVRLRTRFVGLCGTDREIVDGGLGEPPSGASVLVLGHELVAEIEAVGDDVADLRPGQPVTALVRRPCPDCPACRAGRPDACLSGGFREYGIKGLHGFARPTLILPAEAIVPLDGDPGALGVLAEPLSVVEKAVELATDARRRRAPWGDAPWKALVVGCGSVGLLAIALLRLRGHTVTTVDRRPSANPAARIAVALGATYRHVDDGDALAVLDGPGFDCAFEASGDAATALAVHEHLAPGGVQVQIGVAADSRSVAIDANRRIRDDVARQLQVIGTASASREHLMRAVADLSPLLALPPFRSIVTGQHAPEEFEAALWPGPEAIKTVLSFDGDRA